MLGQRGREKLVDGNLLGWVAGCEGAKDDSYASGVGDGAASQGVQVGEQVCGWGV